jgi:hypothetical protein
MKKDEAMTSERVTIAIGLMIVVGLLFGIQPQAGQSATQENHCFTCHTNPRKLVEITRAISRSKADKPGASAETKGEG